MVRIVLDPWQKEFIEYEGDKVLVAGRQTGKSEAQAYDCAQFAATHPGTNTLIVSKTERQAEELLIKTLQFLQEFYPQMIGKGEYKPLKSEIWLMHQGHTKKQPKVSRVMSLPVGLAGEGIRTFTIHKTAVDEAQLPPDPVYDAILPMMLTTGGKISLTGTPQGKKGFFWKAFENKENQFRVFHVNSEKVTEERPLSDSWTEFRRKSALDFLAKMKVIMSPKRYRQEFMGEFIEDLDQMFPDDVLLKCCVLESRKNFLYGRRYFLGVDVGRVIDPSTFEILDATNQDAIEQVENMVRHEYSIPRSAEQIVELDHRYNFTEIGVDGGGMGAGVVDLLLDNDQVKRRTSDLNNAMRKVEHGDKGKKKTLLKEDMYRNLLSMMIQGKIKLLKDENVFQSLKSCQIEYVEGSKEVKIFGNDTHIAEGLIRAAWLARGKNLSIWIDGF